MKTEEILFPAGSIKTDSLLYREKSYLLLPEPGTQNLFLAVSNEVQTRFFISSDSLNNMSRLESFFYRDYGTTFEETEMPSLQGGGSLFMRPSMLNFRSAEFYHPRFVRNLLDFTSVDTKAMIAYRVSIRSGSQLKRKDRKFNLGISIGFDSQRSLNEFRDIVNAEIRDLRVQSGFRLKMSDSRKIYDRKLVRPFNLINFVRIPSEHDLAL